MLKNTKTAVGSVFLALGLFSNGVYGSMSREERIKNSLVLAKNSKEFSGKLKESGVDSTFKCEGQTVLYMTKNPEIAKWAIKQSVDINSQDDYGNSVLHHLVEWALNSFEGDENDSEIKEIIEMMDILAKHRINPFLKNSNGQTAHQIVIEDMGVERELSNWQKSDPEEKKRLDGIRRQSEELAQRLGIMGKSWIEARIKEIKEKLERDSQTEEKHP